MRISDVNHNIVKRIFLLIIFLTLSLLFVLPFAKTGTIFFSDDMYYHIQRINELITNNKSGNFFIGIYTNTFDKIGYPLNLFYPWVTLLPFVLFSLAIKNQVLAIYLGIAFFNFLTLIFTYWTTKKYCKRTIQAFTTALIYTFCSYRTIDIFARFALGEFIALTFLPLCVYGLYAILKGQYKDWPFLAFGMSFVLLSHILSTYIYSIFLVIILIICLLKPIDNKKVRFISFIKAVITAITSSAIFLFPFLEQELFQQFKQPSKMDMVNQALIPSQLFSASLNNTLGRVDAGNTYNIGIVLLIILIIGIINFHRFESNYKLIFIISLLLLAFTTILFPWPFLQKTQLSLIQFPWRFLGPVSYLLSLIGGYEACIFLQKEESLKKNFLLTLILAFLLVPWYSGIINMKNDTLSPSQYLNYHLITYDKEGFKYTRKIKSNLLSLYYLDQYSPQKGLRNINDVINHNAMINGEKVKITNIKSGPNSLEYNLKRFKNAENIILPIYMYKNLQATNGKGKQLNISSTEHSQVKIKTTFGSSKILIRYRLSKLDILSILLSCFTWLIGLIIFIRYFFLKKIKGKF